MATRKRVSFIGTRSFRKPTTVVFRRSDGSIARFRATKIVRRPVKVSFYARRKKYR